MAFKCYRWTLANILPVAFVIWVIGSIWVLYVWLHLLALLQPNAPPWKLDIQARARGQWQTVVSQTLTFLLMVCFGRAIFTDPGSVPQTPEWLADIKGSKKSDKGTEREPLQAGAQYQELKQSGERRFCKWCDNYKPDRCHHCRICKSCILRMDHHCPWIANCVGFRNHKYFFLLVFYALLNLIFIIATMMETMFKAIDEETVPMRRFLLVFCMTLASLMGMLLVVFFHMHVWLMLSATTTIEFCEKQSKRPCTVPLSYDLGCYSNICAVLGAFPPLWLLPIVPPAGEGLSFQAKKELPKDSSPEGQPEKYEGSSPQGDQGICGARKIKEPEASLPPEVTGTKTAVA